jgi:hypothetical protein
MRYATLLPAPTFSGRVVRFRPLSIPERDEILLKASVLAKGSDDPRAFGLHQTREGIKAMLVGVSKTGGIERKEDMPLKDAEYEALTPEKLEIDDCYRYDRLFGVKDDDAIVSLYNRLHLVKQAEVDAIFLAAMTLSED